MVQEICRAEGLESCCRWAGTGTWSGLVVHVGDNRRQLRSVGDAGMKGCEERYDVVRQRWSGYTS